MLLCSSNKIPAFKEPLETHEVEVTLSFLLIKDSMNRPEMPKSGFFYARILVTSSEQSDPRDTPVTH